MTSQGENNNTEIKSKARSNLVRIIVVVVLLAALAFGAKKIFEAKAGQNAGTMNTPQAPIVVLHEVKNSDFAVQREYIGKVEAIQNVSLKPQVSGEITNIHFKEGSMVKSGQVLISIDNSQFKATVDLRKAEVEKTEANLDRASKYFERMKAADKRSVSKSDLDIAESEVLQGKAAVAQAKATLRLAQIDLAHTKITAPISGRIGAAIFTKGNYVSPSTGALATIVQMDPIRVSFALPDKDYLNQLEVYRKNGNSVYDTTLRLTNGRMLPAKGTRDFEDNRIDEKTGTLMMRLRFKNDSGLLIPGSMVRLGTKPVQSQIVNVIPQIAVLADAEGDYVYVVGDDNIVQQRRISLGSERGSMREVKEGLTAGDKIIVQGLQSVRPGIKVKPEMESDDVVKNPAEIAMESEADADNNASSSSDSSVPASQTAEKTE